MAKIASPGDFFTVAQHHDVDGRTSWFVRKKKNNVSAAMRARLQCIAEHARGVGGDWRSRRQKLAAAARACPSGGRGRARASA
jgi:hypothetical protein